MNRDDFEPSSKIGQHWGQKGPGRLIFNVQFRYLHVYSTCIFDYIQFVWFLFKMLYNDVLAYESLFWAYNAKERETINLWPWIHKPWPRIIFLSCALFDPNKL